MVTELPRKIDQEIEAALETASQNLLEVKEGLDMKIQQMVMTPEYVKFCQDFTNSKDVPIVLGTPEEPLVFDLKHADGDKGSSDPSNQPEKIFTFTLLGNPQRSAFGICKIHLIYATGNNPFIRVLEFTHAKEASDNPGILLSRFSFNRDRLIKVFQKVRSHAYFDGGLSNDPQAFQFEIHMNGEVKAVYGVSKNNQRGVYNDPAIGMWFMNNPADIAEAVRRSSKFQPAICESL